MKLGNITGKKLIELGFDNLMIRPNQNISQYLSKRFFTERGNPKMHWDAGVTCFPVQIALKYNIKAIFYAEDSESEYGGRVLNKKSIKLMQYDAIIEQHIEDHPSNWVNDKVSQNDIQPYLYPDIEDIKKKKLKVIIFPIFLDLICIKIIWQLKI